MCPTPPSDTGRQTRLRQEPGHEASVTPWEDRTRLQAVQFEWEEAPRLRVVRLASGSAQAGDPVRVMIAGVEVEGRIQAVETSTLRVRIGRRLF